jgi:hypothetical protein
MAKYIICTLATLQFVGSFRKVAEALGVATPLWGQV